MLALAFTIKRMEHKMNHVYHIVFNHSLGLWQVVGEHARRQGKRGSATRKRRSAHVSLPKTLIALASLSGLPALALAASITGSGDIVPTLPTGPLTDWYVYDVLHIGQQGAGTLSVRDGGKLFSYTSRIGTERGSEGSVTIAGAGSTWTHAGHLVVGQAGQGTLNVEDGGHVSNNFASIGEQAGSFGRVRITGGSSWQTSALWVGWYGQGELVVDGGSQVSSSLPGFIGSAAGSEGIVTISGAGSRWSLTASGNDGRLQVGDSGRGTLNILDGGKVTSASGAIGFNPGALGHVAVSGRDSSWVIEDALRIGYGGTGSLDIREGANVISRLGTIGDAPGGKGVVKVSGPGSTWELRDSNSANNLFIGTAGTGTLQIQNGGSVAHSSGYIGGVGGTGAVTVTGPDSRWTSASLLSVGHSGEGSLSIRDGATATSQNGVIGNLLGSKGQVTVTGPGSQWISGQKLEVGLQSKGTLEILEGGKVKSQSNHVGNSATGQGAVRVSGAGSVWEAGQSVSVGQNGGTGTLTVEDGGKVSSEAISIGTNLNSKGEVVVRTGAHLEASFGLTVGSQAGQGALRIEQGGQVSSGTSMIGSIDATGHVTVKDAGSLWKADEVSIGFATGGAEASTLTLSDGGTLQTGRVSLASFLDDAATLNIGAAEGAAATGAGRLEAPEVYFGQGAATINFNHTDANYDFDATLLSDSARHDGHQIDQRSGTTRLTADNAGYLGVTNVHAGKLVVADRIGGKAQVHGGTLQFGDGDSGRLSQLDALSVTGADSTLAVQGPAAIKVNGDLSMADQTRLSLVSPGATPAIQANSMTLGQDVAFNLSGIRNASELDKVLIDTRDGIRGDFGRVTVGGFDGTVDYLTLNTRKSDDGKQYLASYGLSWTAGNNLAHGTFTLTNDGDSFDVGAALADQVPNPSTSWDGKSLTKQGKGTLILSADNTYSGGTRIAEGTLQLGNGGSTGSIVGDVFNNGTLAFNRRDTYTFDGHIDGSGQLVQRGSGSTVLTQDNTYAGGTVLAGGTLQVARDENLGQANGGLRFEGGTLKASESFDSARAITLAQAGTFEVAEGKELGLNGQVSGPGDLRKVGAGTLRLTDITNAYGNTWVEAGTLVGNAASLSGTIGNAATVVFDQTGDARYDGNIVGMNGNKGRMVKQGAGTLSLAGRSQLDWSIQDGSLSSAAERFSGNVDIAAGASLAFEQTRNATYAGELSGAGRFVKRGEGELLLQQDSAGFNGLTEVEAGKLIVNSHLGGSLRVSDGATLAGSGTIGSGAGSLTTLAAGSTLAPGNSIGTLTVDGNLNFQKGSRFEVETNPGGKNADLVRVTGHTQLDGGSVAHIGATGNYRLRSTYTLLSSEQGLSGTFDDVTSDFAFLNPSLLYDYEKGTVDLSLTRKDRAFDSVALTRNQRATARGLDSIGFDSGHPVYDAFVQLPDDLGLIRGSLDQLSGEIHASMKSALIEESHIVRNAATDRLRAAFDDVAASSSPVMAYEDGKMKLLTSPIARHGAIWAQGFGAWGHTDSDGNAASLKRSTGGLLLGADAPVFGTWRLGVLAGYSHTSADVNDRSSSGKSDNYHLGAYAGNQWELAQGTLGLRTGLTHTWHHIETSRSVDFPGLSNKLKDHYRAGTLQTFADLGYRIDTPSASVEPFVNLAHSQLRSKGFSERGGEAALHGRAQDTDTTFTTLGLRASAKLAVAGIESTARGSLGWRHALGDTTPLSTHAFSAGNTFTVAGAPLAKNAALVEAGVDMALSPSTNLGLSYDGQFAGSTRQHGVKANISIRF